MYLEAIKKRVPLLAKKGYCSWRIGEEVNKHDRLKVTANEVSGIKTVPSEKVFPEYYLLRVKNYEKEEAESGIEEWMRYLKWGYIDPDTTTRGLHEAYDRLLLLKMPKAERKEYEAHMWNLSYQRSVIQASKQEGRTEAMLEVIQKLKALGVSDDIIQSIQ